MAVVRLRCFAAAREAAGTGTDEFDATTLGDLVDAARARYGPEWAEVAAHARVWVNGDEPRAGAATVLAAGDEVAVLPPVSGGAS
jgi:MoaD family protein